jgi:anti-anti-sigma regulatory factor
MHLHDFRFRADASDARSFLTAEVDDALAHETAPNLRITLDGDRLPEPMVRALVKTLRRLREHGGNLEIVAGTPAIAEAIALLGLEPVFAGEHHTEEIPARTAPLRPRKRSIAAGLTAGLALLAAAGIPANAASSTAAALTDPQEIVGHVIARNPNLSSYQGRVHIDVHGNGFLAIVHEHLDGTTYYKRPSNYEVVFDKVPGYAKGFERLFTDVGDPAGWAKRFVMTYEGQVSYRGHDDAQIRMVQRVRGMIDHETVLVDPVAGTVDSLRYDYYNGGQITMTQTFANVGGYTVLASQDAEIAIPHVRAHAHGDYVDYRTNVAVDDAIFTRKNDR